jgi:hypothetical protein
MPIPTGAVYSYPSEPYVSATLGNKVYFIGEFTFSSRPSERLLVYDAENGSWSQGAPALCACFYGSAGTTTGIFAPKRLYVFSMGTYSNQAYDPENNSWTVGVDLPTGRNCFGVATLDDQLYIIGGYTPSWYSNNFGPSAANEQYTPTGYGTVPPIISAVSPETKTYNVSNIALTFVVNKPASWMGYSLDGQDNVTITGNTTLAGLSNGLHNLTVYAKDAFENVGASETVYFTVAQAPEPFLTTLIAVASVAVIAVVAVAGYLYYKRRK